MVDPSAQIVTELCRPEALKLQVDRVERVVGARHAQRRVHHLLVVLLDFGTVRGRQVNVLKPPPTADVQAEHEVEIVPLLDPILHHVFEAVAALRRQAGLPAVGKLVDDVHAIVVGPLLDHLLLDGHGVLLAVARRVPVVRHAAEAWRWRGCGCFFLRPPRTLITVAHHGLLDLAVRDFTAGHTPSAKTTSTVIAGKYALGL